MTKEEATLGPEGHEGQQGGGGKGGERALYGNETRSQVQVGLNSLKGVFWIYVLVQRAPSKLLKCTVVSLFCIGMQ